ncbi:hypothetical protein PanWU01x14_158970, partial [Parasponia andersonii]
SLEAKSQFCILEGDSRAVISSISTGVKYWEIANSTDQFESLDCNFISRGFNYAAYNLAQWALVCNMEGVYPCEVIPNSVFCNSTPWGPNDP